MAQKSQQLTRQRFGNTMQLFAPMYLSNECTNTCTYCGFSREHQYKRVTLNDDQILKEGIALRNRGFRHVLLLTGESPKTVGVDYIANAISLLSPFFSSIGIEVQPLNHSGYSHLIKCGTDKLTLYQETYHLESYKKYHLFGLKKNYENRLSAVEEAGLAGFNAINLGVLLGLYDWRYDVIALAYHAIYMMKYYWKSQYGVSFPRIKDMIGQFKVNYPVSDADLLQIICAFRLCFPSIGITLSTREPKMLRDALFNLGITTISAESKTAPGAYSAGLDAESQFHISDSRTLEEITTILDKKGLEPVFKDWQPLITSR
jgi:2-iminoacetate synthase